MRGQILDFSISNSTGIINGEDGKRYTFTAAEWKEPINPTRGMQVDFDVDEQGNAISVYQALTSGIQTTYQQNYSNFEQPDSNSLFSYYVNSIKTKYATFNGRARRREYWGFVLFNTIISLVIGFVIGILATAANLPALANISYLYDLVVFIPSLAVGVRRLHDIGKSGWWWLILFIPLVGWIILLAFHCKDSQPGDNQYGSNPKM